MHCEITNINDSNFNEIELSLERDICLVNVTLVDKPESTQLMFKGMIDWSGFEIINHSFNFYTWKLSEFLALKYIVLEALKWSEFWPA